MARSVIFVGLLLTFAAGAAAVPAAFASDVAPCSANEDKAGTAYIDPANNRQSGENGSMSQCEPGSETNGQSPCTAVKQSAEFAPAGTSAMTDALPFKYVGNSYSCIFHRPSCPFGQCISAHHVRFFAKRFNATAAGYRPCGYCLPKNWTTVHAVLLGNQSQRQCQRHETPP